MKDTNLFTCFAFCFDLQVTSPVVKMCVISDFQQAVLHVLLSSDLAVLAVATSMIFHLLLKELLLLPLHSWPDLRCWFRNIHHATVLGR